jgi:hypothetical protein
MALFTIYEYFDEALAAWRNRGRAMNYLQNESKVYTMPEREYCHKCGEFRYPSHIEPGLSGPLIVMQCRCVERDERVPIKPTTAPDGQCGTACYGWDFA